MVTKKQRRKQMSRARTGRQAVRRRQREVRNQRIRIVAVGLVLLLVTGTLVAWVLLHDSGDTASRTAAVYYDGGAVVRPAPATIEVGP